MEKSIRYDWDFEELEKFYGFPFLELISLAHRVHLDHHKVGEIQVCSLISIKTGGCPEDCRYCAQSSLYQTGINAEPLMSYEEVMQKAKEAKEQGASRICLGAALRGVREGKQFEEILKMVKGVSQLGVEVCCTLGMLNASKAQRLKEAGLHSYNHNLDTSRSYYPNIVTTRTYQDRLDTLQTIQEADLHVCCGAILGLGEKVQDRLEFLHLLSQRNPHPASVPINLLTPIPNTPLEKNPPVPLLEFIRIVAIARIVMPHAMVRLSAGRSSLSLEAQALCFFAGANSIHAGEKLLTVSNIPCDKDEEMFSLLGLTKMKGKSC